MLTLPSDLYRLRPVCYPHWPRFSVSFQLAVMGKQCQVDQLLHALWVCSHHLCFRYEVLILGERGTSWGAIPFHGVYTSYDYGASVSLEAYRLHLHGLIRGPTIQDLRIPSIVYKVRRVKTSRTVPPQFSGVLQDRLGGRLLNRPRRFHLICCVCDLTEESG